MGTQLLHNRRRLQRQLTRRHDDQALNVRLISLELLEQRLEDASDRVVTEAQCLEADQKEGDPAECLWSDERDELV